MFNYKDLIVWQKSLDLVLRVYKLTRHFSFSERNGIVSQMRPSSVSMPSNIAEGSRRRLGKERRHFLIIAFGSAAELETQIIISKKLSFMFLMIHMLI